MFREGGRHSGIKLQKQLSIDDIKELKFLADIGFHRIAGRGPDGFYYYIPAGYKKIQEDGSSEDYMLFQGTSYARWTSESGWSSKDFRVLVDGSIEILEAKNNFADGGSL